MAVQGNVKGIWINIRLSGQEDRHITKTRAALLPVAGLFWKKKYRYTVIEYDDGLQNQIVILDFHKEADKAQKLIYQNMVDARKKASEKQGSGLNK